MPRCRARARMALLLAIGLAGGAQAATWTITPELKRLDAGDTELPAGLADVARDQSLRVGLYVRASSDGASSTMVGPIGFESLLGAIHFESDGLAGGDIAAIHQGAGQWRGLGAAHDRCHLQCRPGRTPGTSAARHGGAQLDFLLGRCNQRRRCRARCLVHASRWKLQHLSRDIDHSPVRGSRGCGRRA